MVKRDRKGRFIKEGMVKRFVKFFLFLSTGIRNEVGCSVHVLLL